MSLIEELNFNLLGLSLSFMEIQDIVRFSQTNKNFHSQINKVNHTWQSILSEWIQTEHSNQIVPYDGQKFKQILRFSTSQFRTLNNQNDCKIIDRIFSLHNLLNYLSQKEDHLIIEGVQASSQDYNQSIFRTLDRRSYDYFWSSSGSLNPNDSEWLIYKVANLGQNQEKALIHSVIISAFLPRFQHGMPIYPPREIQIEVGNSPNHYHYKSPIFAVQQNTNEEQTFCILPDVVVGEYIKITLIGKPTMQNTDKEYYIALRYKIQEIKDNNHQELSEKLFEMRKQLQNNIRNILEEKVLTLDDIIELVFYSCEKYGNIDFSMTMIIFKILDSLKHDDALAYDFIEKIAACPDEINIFYLKEEIDKFLYSQDPDSDIKQGTKLLFMQVFELPHDAFEYNLMYLPMLNTIEKAFSFINYLGYKIAYSKCKFLDIERILKALSNKFGELAVVAYVGQNIDKILWKNEEKHILRKHLDQMLERQLLVNKN
eukprot:403348128